MDVVVQTTRFHQVLGVGAKNISPELAVRNLVHRQGWAAAGFVEILLRCEFKPEVVHGSKKTIQPRIHE